MAQRSNDIVERTSNAMGVATNPMQQTAIEVRANRVNWQSYYQGRLISEEDYSLISRFDAAQPAEQAQMIEENSFQCAKTLVSLIENVAKDQTVQYVLTMVDDLLKGDRNRTEIFREYGKKNKMYGWSPFLKLLNRSDAFIINQSCKIIAKIICWGADPMTDSDLTYYIQSLKDQLKIGGNPYMENVVRCMQLLLQVDVYRIAFMELEGINSLMYLLSNKVGFQMQYQVIFCFWCLSFNSEISSRMNNYGIIPVMADILCEAVKEKVTRIILATLRNMVEKPDDMSVVKDHALAMVQCKVLKQLVLFEVQKFEDPELTDDVEFMNEFLQTSVQDLSSFDEYCSEVKSGRLEWSPVHKSDKFWRENVTLLNEKNYEILKILIRLLETSKDPLILSVAAHDCGEYVRHYPRGKNVIEQLGGKQLVMQYLSHEDPNVRYEALMAVQKIMVHNWEYLGKQLASEQVKTESNPTVTVRA